MFTEIIVLIVSYMYVNSLYKTSHRILHTNYIYVKLKEKMAILNESNIKKKKKNFYGHMFYIIWSKYLGVKLLHCVTLTVKYKKLSNCLIK